MNIDVAFAQMLMNQFGEELDPSLLHIKQSLLDAPPTQPVLELEAVFEKYFPVSKAFFFENGNPFAAQELTLRARYFLLEEMARRMQQLGGATAAIEGLLRSYVERNPNSSAGKLVLAQFRFGAGDFETAATLTKGVMIRSIYSLLPQQLYLEMLRATHPGEETADGFFLGDLSDRFCPIPFDDVELDCQGSAWTCCPSQLPVPIGNFFTTPWEEIWPSEKARELRRSILQGDFSYCSRTHCTRILSGSLPRRQDLAGTRYEPLLNDPAREPLPPVKAIFGQDASCNLVCPQCRTEPYRLPPEQAARLDQAMVHVVEPILEHAARVPFTVFMAGHGDPFASEHYLGILRRLDPDRHSQLELRLLTNGLLFKQSWHRLPNIHPLMPHGCVKVSLDGASPDVYRLTRGASWDKLMENLEFLADLRRLGRVGSIGVNMTVQACNFHDMGRLAELADRLGFDTLEFNALRNEGTYTLEDFQSRAVFEPAHPEHGDFLEAFRSPVLRSRIITFGTLTPLFHLAASIQT